MKKWKITLWLLFFSSVAAAQSEEGVVIPQDSALLRIRGEIIQEIEQGQISSLAIGVIKDGQILWQEALGFSDVEQNIFQPLGMKNTYAYPVGNAGQEPHLVSIYNEKMSKLERGFIAYPAGGMGFWASLSDMNRYLLFHLGVCKNETVVDTHSLRRMHEFRQGPADLFGIGWFNQGGELFSNGNVSGGNASVSVSRAHGFAVVCLLNRTSWDGMADQFAGKIKGVFIKKAAATDTDRGNGFTGLPTRPGMN